MYKSPVSGLGQGVAAWLSASTAANLALIIADKTGTAGNLVFSVSPTFTGTVTFGAANFSGAVDVAGNFSVATNKFTVAAATGNTIITGTLGLSGALTYGGVTLSNAVTGTGNMVLSASATLTGTLTAAAANFSGAVDVAGNFSVATNKLTVTASNGNAVLAGALIVRGGSAQSVPSSQVGQLYLSGALTTDRLALGVDGTGASMYGWIQPVDTLVNWRDLQLCPIGGSVIVGKASGLPLSVLSGQIQFPATQNPSSDANTLDDYEEGTWTPALTFATPGNLNVAYAILTARYIKIGSLVSTNVIIVTSTFTHTTAAGDLRVTGLPFTCGTNGAGSGALTYAGITKAGYMDFLAVSNDGQTYLKINACGTGIALASVTVADVPTGGTVVFATSNTYYV